MLKLVLSIMFAMAVASCAPDDGNGSDTQGGGPASTGGGDSDSAGDTASFDGDAEGICIAPSPLIDSSCTNTADQAILNDPTFDIAVTTEDCVVPAGCLTVNNKTTCIACCMVESSGLSVQCASCFAGSSACTINSLICSGPRNEAARKKTYPHRMPSCSSISSAIHPMTFAPGSASQIGAGAPIGRRSPLHVRPKS